MAVAGPCVVFACRGRITTQLDLLFQRITEHQIGFTVLNISRAKKQQNYYGFPDVFHGVKLKTFK